MISALPGRVFEMPLALRPGKLRLVESALPVERFFALRHNESSIAGRRPRVQPYFLRHRAVLGRLTSSGRNFIRSFVELTGGGLADLQIVSRTSQLSAFVSLAPHVGQPFKSTFLLVGPGDQGGLLMTGAGSINLRAGDLWHAERGVAGFLVETTPGYSELLLLLLES
jgi:hypothetical protein